MDCPKCGFEIQEAGSAACPKCGVVIAKVLRAREEEADFQRGVAAERSISAAFARRMEEVEEIRSQLEDPEDARDEEAYPVAGALSIVFAFLAFFTAVTEILGLISFYHWGKLIFKDRELIQYTISLAVASVASVAVLLAISEGLKMGRDVANHTRAMREYLRRMGGR